MDKWAADTLQRAKVPGWLSHFHAGSRIKTVFLLSQDSSESGRHLKILSYIQ